MADKEVKLEALMVQALNGDPNAYGQLLRATSRLLRPYLAKRLSLPNDVEDLLQEILISIHKARHTYDGNRPFKPWLYAIANFRLQDYLRMHYADSLRQAEPLEDMENLLADPVTKPHGYYESIRNEIGKLPPQQARIVELMHHDGYTAAEVAEKTGMKVSAVKVAAFRAYKELRKKLEM